MNLSEIDRVLDAENVHMEQNDSDDDIFEELLDDQQKAAGKKEKKEIVKHEAELSGDEAKKEEKPKRARKAVAKAAPKKGKKADEEEEENESQEADDEEDEEDEDEEEDDEDSEEKTEKSVGKEEDAEEKSEAEEADDEHMLDVVANEHGVEDAIVKEEGTVEEDAREPVKEKIKKEILDKAIIASAGDDSPEKPGITLKFLEDPENGNVFIGRKKTHLKKYGYEGALHIGRVAEEELQDRNVYMDSLNPHVVFICGARGSGKSYVLGVIAEELAKKNHNIGTIVIDPVGVFWSMRFPNREEREMKTLAQWDFAPEGLDNLKVFIPEGMASDTPRNTYDATFSLPPSLLIAEDWALTFGIERFSPAGLLLEIVIKKVKQGYNTIENEKVKPKGDAFSLENLIECLETDSVLHSKERGYKPDSIRALSSRFEAAKTWGIFSRNGTPLSALSREGQLTIIDTSFLDDNVSALVIGLLARRVLAARKLTTRKEAAKRFKTKDVDQMLELDIPPTWLFIDEAHTLIPSGNVKTPATDAIVEYVKQGRRPGCSLVFATQQPSAIDSKVLSQLDIMLAHKLVFDDDIKAIYKRVPTIVPAKYKRSTFIKTLPIGTALTSDRSEETSRAFIMKIRPRMSQHEGREAESVERKVNVNKEDIEKLMKELILGKLEKDSEIALDEFERIVETLNSKYHSEVDSGKILDMLRKEGIVTDSSRLMLNEEVALDEEKAEAQAEKKEIEKEAEKEVDGMKGKPELLHSAEEKTELLALPVRIKEPEARKIADKSRSKKLFGLLGSNEFVKDLQLRYLTVWRINYDAFNEKKEFVQHECFIDSLSGEFIHFDKGRFIYSKGLPELKELGEDAAKLLSIMGNGAIPVAKITEKTGFSENKTRNLFDKLHSAGFMEKTSKNGKVAYALKKKPDLPPNPTHSFLESVKQIPFVRLEAASKDHDKFNKKDAIAALKNIWPNVVVRNVYELNRPVYYATIATMDGREKPLKIDGLSGEIIR